MDAGGLIDRRSERRLITLLRTAKLHLASRETICRLRNVSANGFMADVCPAPSPGEPVELELEEGQRLAARVVWSRLEQIGVEFDRAQDVVRLVGPAAGTARLQGRAVRMRPEGAYANIVCESKVVAALVLNISQTGVALAPFYIDGPLPRRDELRIEIDGLSPAKGVLCWANNGRLGIRFSDPIAFEALAHWLWAISLAARSPRSTEPSLPRRRA
jgi:hypothetical protein